MQLSILSNMAHYRRADGVIVGHGATVRELDALATLFTRVRHVACLHPGAPPASALPYRADIELVPVAPAGGEALADKLAIVRETPSYLRAIRRELRTADALHVRAPANLPMYAIAMLPLARTHRRWVKYAGNWSPDGPEPRSYRLQRELLARPWHGAQVTVNGHWPGQPAHVHSFENPCLDDDELAAGARAAAGKALAAPLRLVFAAHLGAAKGPRIAIDALRMLARDGIAARLDLAGDGPELDELRRHADGLDAHFHGALPRAGLDALYARAHFVVLPSRTEGWPKVLAEGMAAGALPIATAVGSIPQKLAEIGAGRAVATVDAEAFASAIRGYLEAPARWATEVALALAGARRFSYAVYLDAVRRLFEL